MLISLNWVRQHCPFTTEDSPRRIGEIFSLATAEVEGVELFAQDLNRFVVAKVLELEPIPKAKKLRKALIDAGNDEPVTVVCGAPNVEVGMHVPFAAPGITVGDLTLKKAKIFGVESSGMLLSEKELGLSEDHSGLLELPSEFAPGTPLDELYKDAEDIILEVDNKSLTHRPDLWGHYGIAREFSTIYGAELNAYAINESLAQGKGASEVTVQIRDGAARERCRRYIGLRIDGVKVGPSPDWLQKRLLAVGSRPINNLVDITNYILFDLGQPLHAFDREAIQGGEIHVRMASEGEKMTLLDGREIQLDTEDLLIADADRPVALAGVMGGDGSQVSDSTTSIFLESANFEPTSVRRSSIRHGRTDSSARFEKSLDPVQARLAILKAAELVLEFCPEAKIVGELQDVGFEAPEPIRIETSPQKIIHRLGCDLKPDRVQEILDRLGFAIDSSSGSSKKGEDHWEVTVPSWRATRDVSIPQDLVEEVGRIHGYDNIEPFAPLWPVSTPQANSRRKLERKIKSHLSYHGGLNEVLTYSMVGEAHCKTFDLDPGAHMLLENSMSEDHDRMRREIIPLHIEKVKENQRYFDSLSFYEVGRVYRKEKSKLTSPDLPDETTRVCGMWVEDQKSDANFYEVRSLLLSLIQALGLGQAEVVEAEAVPSWAHPQVAAQLKLGESDLGCFYRLHPNVMGEFDLRGDVLAFDLDFEALMEAESSKVGYTPLPRFPDVPFDLSLLAPKREPVRNLEEIAYRAGGELLKSVKVFDIYQGKGLEEDQKSVSLNLVFRSDEGTLSAEEIEALQNSVIEAFSQAGFPIR